MKKITFFLVLAFVAGMLFTSCQKEDEPQVGSQNLEMSVSKTELTFNGPAQSSESFILKTNGSWECSYNHDGDIESVKPRTHKVSALNNVQPYMITVTVPEVANPPEAGTKVYCGVIHIKAYDPSRYAHDKAANVTVYRQY